METIYTFFIGCIFGSFLQVVIDRAPQGEDFILSRSHCDACHHVLHAVDLIPLVSYFIHRGHCRYCKAKITAKYPLTETVIGLLAVIYVSFFGLTIRSLVDLFLITLMIAIFVIDYHHMIIPDTLNLLILPEVIYYWVADGFTLSNIFGLSVSLLMIMVSFFYKDSIGGGDIKYLAVLGLLFGYPKIIFLLAVSTTIASLYALYELIRHNKSLRSYIAFGPFISLSAIFFLILNHIGK